MKVQKSFTIKEEILKLIKQEALKQKRSESWIVDEILSNYFKLSSSSIPTKKEVKT